MEFSGLEPAAVPFFKSGVVGQDLNTKAHDSRHSRAIIITRSRVPGEKGGERRVSHSLLTLALFNFRGFSLQSSRFQSFNFLSCNF